MENVTAALEALGSYDIEQTKQALRYLVREGELAAIEHIAPLTAHPDVAIRYFAKRALSLLRKRHGGRVEQAASPAAHVASSAPADDTLRLSPVEPSPALARASVSPALARKKPDYFKVSIVI